MALSDTAIRKSKPGDKPRKLADASGLYLLLNPNGSRWWRFKYRQGGKEKLLSLGTYPDTSLADARVSRDNARKLLAAGGDPSEQRKAMKLADASTDSFESVAREWFAKFSKGWAVTHASKIMGRLVHDVFPFIGTKPIGDITAPELLTALRRIESRGAVETAHRVHQNCGQIFRYAVATGRAQRDPSGDLRGALAPWKPQHYSTITDTKEIGALLRAMDGYAGAFVTKCALRLAPLVFVRPGELRRAEWSEFDLANAEWRIPAAKMKARELHIVPLSRQAVATLSELQQMTGSGQWVFPSVRTGREPMSENTVNAALRRLGYSKEQLTGHGFRSMASTLLNEQGWHRDAIERQLAHAERNAVRAAYNYAEHLPERRRMMQSWSDYLEQLAKGADVVPIRKGKRNDGR